MKPGRQPSRYDLVVFKLPREESRLAIGRVLGLPGEQMELSSGRVMANDIEIADPYVTSKASYSISMSLGQNEYAVFGDNRDLSDDSHTRGPIGEELIVGSTTAVP